jgi:probable rRNA maturation factor
MTENIIIDIQIASDAGSVPTEDVIGGWIAAALDSASESTLYEVSIRIVDEPESRQLNNDYRGKDSATNVLSFPGDDDVLPDDAPRSLGDIVICAPIVEREADEQGKAAADHWAHLLVHGTLHLLGYDHEIDEDATRMEALETDILATRGVADPYAN